MPGSDPPTERDVAADLRDYLRETDGVCAEGNVHGWRWVRFHDGDWQATKYNEGNDRLRDYVEGDVLDESTVLEWLVSKPFTLIPESEAYLWGPSEKTVWQHADEQDVFTDLDRCGWCGASERTANVDAYDTVEDGRCLLCEDCYESWDDAGEIAHDDGEVTAT